MTAWPPLNQFVRMKILLMKITAPKAPNIPFLSCSEIVGAHIFQLQVNIQ